MRSLWDIIWKILKVLLVIYAMVFMMYLAIFVSGWLREGRRINDLWSKPWIVAPRLLRLIKLKGDLRYVVVLCPFVLSYRSFCPLGSTIGGQTGIPCIMLNNINHIITQCSLIIESLYKTRVAHLPCLSTYPGHHRLSYIFPNKHKSLNLINNQLIIIHVIL